MTKTKTNMINNENYEGYLMRYADGELNETEVAKVEAYLERHPELREELDEVSSPTLHVAAPAATMPCKERMMHTETAFVPIGRKRAIWSAAAAVALLIIAVAVVRSLSSSDKNGSLTAGLPQYDSTRQEAIVTAADSIPFDSIYINPTQKPPVFLAGNSSAPDSEKDVTPINTAIVDTPIAAPIIVVNNESVLIADNAVHTTTRRIVGGIIIVETDNLVNIEPTHTPSGNPNAIRGYTIENSQLAMAADKGLVGRAVNVIASIFNRPKDNDTLLAFNE